MRHVYNRGTIGLNWLATSVLGILSHSFQMAGIYAVLGGAFLYSAFSLWKRERDGKGDK